MRSVLSALFIIVLGAILPATEAASAQPGKMYCWKNKAGKTECGDKVPYEFQDATVKEMNKQGVVTGRTEALTPEERKAHEAAEEKRIADAKTREEQRRKDKALLDTFSNEKEIDLKRARDIQLIDSNIETLQTNLKNMTERQQDARARADQYAKDKRPVPPAIQDELDRVRTEMAQTGKQITQMRSDIVSLNQRYDELKKRFAELTGSAPSSTSSPPQKKPATQSASEQKSR